MTSGGINKTWQLLEYKNPGRLSDTVLQLHHAIQFIALADKYLPPVPPESARTAITWDVEREAYLGKFVEAEEPFRIALKAGSFDLLVLGENMMEKARLHLAGDTRGYVYSWLKENIAGCCEEWSRLRPVMPYKLPEHPIDKGKPFRIADPLALKEITRYRNNAYRLFLEISKTYAVVSEIVICPHTFNTECLLAESGKKGSVTGGILLGLSLGDQQTREPYFFYSQEQESKHDRNKLMAADVLMLENADDQYNSVMEFFGKLI